LYITLRGRWCDFIVLNVLAPTEDKRDATEDSLNGEVERVFDHFWKYTLKFCLDISMQN